MKQPVTRRIRRSTAGLTLLELAVVAVILLVVLGSVTLLAQSSDRMYRTETIASHVESQVVNVMEQLYEELRMTGADTLTPPLGPGVGVSSVLYVQATGVAAGQVVWTPLRRLELQLEIGELDDGLDNNGNDLIDEGRIVLTEDVGGPQEHSRVITHWVPEMLEGELPNGIDDNGNGLVDEPGFCLERADRTLVVRLTLARRTVDGRILVRTSQTSVRPRNLMDNSP